MGRPSRRDGIGSVARYTRIGIFSRERGSLRRAAWMATGPEGISIGVARGPGRGTTYTYHSDGSFYRSLASLPPQGPRVSQELVARHPPLKEVKGLLYLLSVDVSAADRMSQFPFKRRFEPIFVRQLDGRVTFKIGLLEPGVPEALDTVKRKEERHFRLITKTVPWVLLWNAAGFEPSVPVRRTTRFA